MIRIRFKPVFSDDWRDAVTLATRSLRSLVIWLLATGALGCALILPEQSRSDVSVVSPELAEEATLRDLHARYMRHLENSGAVDRDSAYAQLANQLLYKLRIERKGVKAKACLLRDPGLNAMVFEDGTICIYSGLLSKLTNPDQLAFILAHEGAHWTHNHAILNFRQSNRVLLASKVADTVIAPVAAKFQVKPLAEWAVNSASLVVSSHYSRELEDEADRESVAMLVRAGYNPKAAVEVIRILGGDEELDTNFVPELTATHSSGNSRYQELIKAIEIGYAGEHLQSTPFDRNFVRATAPVRLANASWAARSGDFFDALEGVDLVLRSFAQQERSVPWSQAQAQRAEIFLSMVRDSSFVRNGVSVGDWEHVYGTMSQEEIVLTWCREAHKAMQSAQKHRTFTRELKLRWSDSACAAMNKEGF